MMIDIENLAGPEQCRVRLHENNASREVPERAQAKKFTLHKKRSFLCKVGP